jgi:FAD/FMN-containing dehydrogenase
MSIAAKETLPPLPAGFLDKLAAIVGDAGLITDPADMVPYLEETRGLYDGASPAIVRPASTRDVAAVMQVCAQANVAIVPQGGNTGLCGGGVASGEIIVNLARMNKVRAVDPFNYTMTVDAGCILADLQRVAEDNDRLFPLSLGAEGSCQIGGNLSTNAGGTAVLRYGNARELTLGLEVVLPDGQIWDGLTALRQDNTGYDLKQLFIGAEGTLGIITGAVMKLYPLPRERHTAFVALDDVDAVLDLLSRARRASADTVATFELIPRIGLDLSLKHMPETVDPLADRYEWYALIEFESGESGSGLGAALEGFLATALEDGLIVDATIAQSETQRQQLWFVREAMVLAQTPEGASIKNDISVPISKVPEFIRRADAAVAARCPGVRPVAFGHIGDGNVHYNLQQPVGADDAEFLARWDELTALVIDVVRDLGGSFSAEHGIGLLKVRELADFKSPVELDLMRTVKNALDPKGLMNPGKVL